VGGITFVILTGRNSSSRLSVVRIVTRLRVGRSDTRISIVARDVFFFFSNVQTDIEDRAASYSMGTGALSRG